MHKVSRYPHHLATKVNEHFAALPFWFHGRKITDRGRVKSHEIVHIRIWWESCQLKETYRAIPFHSKGNWHLTHVILSNGDEYEIHEHEGSHPF